MKLSNSDLKVLEILWQYGSLTASELCKKLKDSTNWSRVTSYTIIKRCVEKGVVERTEPNFTCRALVTKEEARKNGLTEILETLFDNSKLAFFQTFISNETLTSDEKEELIALIKDLR